VAADSWLRIVAIGLPLAGAAILWLWGQRIPRARRWVAAVLLALAGSAALALFLLNRNYACILASGRGNCLMDGLGTLGVFLADAVLTIYSALPVAGGRQRAGILILLLSGALAGVGLATNLLVLIVFLNLLFFVIYRWLTGKGLQPRFLVLRDDYGDGEED
jgi:hypothetical protein